MSATQLPTALGSTTTTRFFVLACAIVTALLAVGLLSVSLVPSAGLAQVLLRSVGEARSGTVTQDLAANLGERLRLVAGALVLLAVGLVVMRRDIEVLLSSGLRWLIDTLAGTRRISLSAEMAAVAGITLVSLGVRLAFLNQPMRYDEALSFNEFASRPLYYGLSFYPEPNNHLLNTLLVHVVSALLGSDPWALRLPALVAGVLLVPATYWLGRLAWGSRAGLLAAALVAGSSFLVEYSTNSRGYTLQALCFVVGMCLAIVAVQRATPGPLLWLAVALGLGMYAVPTMLYGIAVIGVWVGCTLVTRDFVPPTPKQFLACAVVLALVCVLVYTPVVLISGPERLLANRFVVSSPLSELANELPRSLARTWSFWNRDVPIVGTALLGVGFVVATVADVRQRRVPLGLLALAVCGVLLLAQRVAPFERVWLFLLPLYFAVASGGLALLAQRLPTLAFQIGSPLIALGLGFATLTSGSILSSQETGAFPDAEGVARALSGQLSAEDAVVTQVPASLPELQFYFPRYGLPTQTLVRTPEQSVHMYVVASADSEPLGIPAGELETVAQLPGSVVYRVTR